MIYEILTTINLLVIYCISISLIFKESLNSLIILIILFSIQIVTYKKEGEENIVIKNVFLNIFNNAKNK